MMRLLEWCTLASMACLLVWCGALIFADLREQARRMEILMEVGK